MNIKNKRKEEKIRNIDYTNQTINRIVHYSNLLNETDNFFKDNGVSDFSQINSSKGLQIINPTNSEILL